MSISSHKSWLELLPTASTKHLFLNTREYLDSNSINLPPFCSPTCVRRKHDSLHIYTHVDISIYWYTICTHMNTFVIQPNYIRNRLRALPVIKLSKRRCKQVCLPTSCTFPSRFLLHHTHTRFGYINLPLSGTITVFTNNFTFECFAILVKRVYTSWWLWINIAETRMSVVK